MAGKSKWARPGSGRQTRFDCTSHADSTNYYTNKFTNSSASTVTVTLSPTYITNNKHSHLSQHAAWFRAHASLWGGGQTSHGTTDMQTQP